MTEFKSFVDPEFVALDNKFSPFGNYFVYTTGADHIELWNARSWKKLWASDGLADNRGGKSEFAPDENYLIFTKYKSKGDIAILRLSDLTITQVINGHSDFITGIAISPDGNYLASIGTDLIVNVYKKKAGMFELLQSFGDYGNSIRVVFSNDGRFLIVGGSESKIVIKELNEGKFVDFQIITNEKYFVRGLTYHPGKNEFATGTSEGIKVYELKGKEFKQKEFITASTGISYSLTYGPTGSYLAGGSASGNLLLFETGPALKQIASIARHNDDILDICFSEDGRYVATSGGDKTEIIWKADNIPSSKRAIVSDLLNNNLTSLQRKILTEKNASAILENIDKNIIKPKDEFESTADFNKRNEMARATVIKSLNNLVEDQLAVKIEKTHVLFPVDFVNDYNADKQEYAISGLNTQMIVKIAGDKAKDLRDNTNNYCIKAGKEINSNTGQVKYKSLQLTNIKTNEIYTIVGKEDPFLAQTKTKSNFRTVEVAENPVDTIKVTISAGDSVKWGNTYILLFANNDYEDMFPQLVNPINDAEALETDLHDIYGAHTELIKNARLEEMISKIREYAKGQYNDNDRLMILFAGHGVYDDVFKEGYIIASDSKVHDNTRTTYLSHSNLRTMINHIPCKHILLLLDVCFGGTIDPVVAARDRAGDVYDDVSKSDFVKRKLKYKTRLYMTSGGKEYVPDGRPGQHSPFTRKLLEAIRSRGGDDGILTVNEIINHLEKVIPQPRAGEFGDNEPGSDFILIAK